MAKTKRPAVPATPDAPVFSLHRVSKAIVEGFGTLLILFNPAPVVPDDEQGTDDELPHRGNTPWYASVPALDLRFMLYEDGKPLVGYRDFKDIVPQVVQFLDELSADPERFDDFRWSHRAWPDFVMEGHKLAPMVVTVPNSLKEFII